jgi:hypothetical protein
MHPLTDANGLPLSQRQQHVLNAVLELCAAKRGQWLCGSDLWPERDEWSRARRDMIGWLADIGALAVQGIEFKREHRRVVFRLPAEQGSGIEEESPAENV